MFHDVCQSNPVNFFYVWLSVSELLKGQETLKVILDLDSWCWPSVNLDIWDLYPTSLSIKSKNPFFKIMKFWICCHTVGLDFSGNKICSFMTVSEISHLSSVPHISASHKFASQSLFHFGWLKIILIGKAQVEPLSWKWSLSEQDFPTSWLLEAILSLPTPLLPSLAVLSVGSSPPAGLSLQQNVAGCGKA